MRHFYLLLVLLSAQTLIAQDFKMVTDWDEAKKLAAAEDKEILVILTGSEWCSTSRDIKKRVLRKDEFKAYVDANVIPFVVDIPSEVCDGNDQAHADYDRFSDKYQTTIFPSMVLANSDGEKIKLLEGKLYKIKNVLAQLHNTPTASN